MNDLKHELGINLDYYSFLYFDSYSRKMFSMRIARPFTPDNSTTNNRPTSKGNLAGLKRPSTANRDSIKNIIQVI